LNLGIGLFLLKIIITLVEFPFAESNDLRKLLEILFLAVLFFCLGCETEPIISISSKPVPVIYAVFDDLDSVHNIVITKSFGADYNPANEARIFDSLFFDEIEVEVEYLPPGWRTEWQAIDVQHNVGVKKDSGFFSYPYNEYYQFNLPLREWKRKFVDSIKIEVRIPGYEDLIGKIKIIDSITISTPKFNQKYVYLVPNSSFKIHWSNSMPWEEPHAWSEIDVSFEFIEELDTGLRSKWVHFQNTQYFLSPHEKYRELSITYEEFITKVLQELKVDDKVKYTYLGEIKMHMTGGDNFMVQYMKYLEGYNDYSFDGYSNIQNGLGILTSVTHFRKKDMYFDFETRKTLVDENRLKKFKFSRRFE